MKSKERKIAVIVVLAIAVATAFYFLFPRGIDYEPLANHNYKGEAWLLSDAMPDEPVAVLSSPDLDGTVLGGIRAYDKGIEVIDYADTEKRQDGLAPYMTVERLDIASHTRRFSEAMSEKYFYAYSNGTQSGIGIDVTFCTYLLGKEKLYPVKLGIVPTFFNYALRPITKWAKIKVPAVTVKAPDEFFPDPFKSMCLEREKEIIGWVPAMVLAKECPNAGFAKYKLTKDLSPEFLTNSGKADMLALFYNAIQRGMQKAVQYDSPVPMDRYFDYNDPSCKEFRNWVYIDFLSGCYRGIRLKLKTADYVEDGKDFRLTCNMSFFYDAAAQYSYNSLPREGWRVTIHTKKGVSPLRITKIEWTKNPTTYTAKQRAEILSTMSKPIDWDASLQKEYDAIDVEQGNLRGD